MAELFHGVFVTESPTSIAPPVLVDSGVQVAVGAAPVHLGNLADPLAPQVAYTYGEAVSKMGASTDLAAYPLCQVIQASFVLYGVAPVVFVNVLDPSIHNKALPPIEVTLEGGRAVLEERGVLAQGLAVKSGDGKAYKLGEDYTLAYDGEERLFITTVEGGAIPKGSALKIEGKQIDPSKVKDKDILAGIGRIREVYPRFGLVPGILLAPGWSHKPEVHLALTACCVGLNSLFRSTALLDLDLALSPTYDKAGEVKDKGGVASPMAIPLWAMGRVGMGAYHLSAVAGAHLAFTDYQNGGVPYVSPSNKAMKISGLCDGEGREIVLDYRQANQLNKQGIASALNLNGWRFWGNRTAACPAATDPKDAFIPVRRMFSWWANTFILTYLDKVDDPMNKRLIEAVVDSENIRANGFKARYQLADARIEYRPEDNPETDLLGGTIRFKQYLTPYPPAETIINDLEFDPYVLSKSLYK